MIKVICLLVDYYKDNNYQYHLEELLNLCSACNYTVENTICQKLDKINNKYYFNCGKINEVAQYVLENDIELIIVNNEITGMQNKNIEKICKCAVLDRTQLILEIFSSRAKTKEAKLQVSIAKLKYFKPRMVGSYGNLSKQGGGSAGTVSRGGGEKQIDLDKRKIDRQISEYQTQLDKFIKTRITQRKTRMDNEIKVVSLVGYTNAGKSSLMNLLADSSEVFVKDMLFATLDTCVRKVTLADGFVFLLVDTVGFVSSLPHELVKAFRSTLEEILVSDLIIHVNDISDPNSYSNINVVENTLKQLNANEIKRIFVNNKIDLVNNYSSKNLAISIKNEQNIDLLLELIKKELDSDYKLVNLLLRYDQISLINKFKGFTVCKIIKHKQDGVLIEVLLPNNLLNKYSNQILQ